MRIALHNCDYIKPEKVEDYIANDGYLTLGKCLTELTPEQVIEEIKTSGLRDRDGAGFPTGKNGKLLENLFLIKNMLFVMQMKVIHIKFQKL